MFSGAEVSLALRGDDGDIGSAQAYTVGADTGYAQSALKKEPLPAAQRIGDDHYRVGFQCLQGGSDNALAGRADRGVPRSLGVALIIAIDEVTAQPCGQGFAQCCLAGADGAFKEDNLFVHDFV